MGVDTSTAVSAVSLEEAKKHLRVEIDTDDDLIKSLCLAATQVAEHEMQRPIISREGEQGFGSKPEDVPAAIRQWVLLTVAHYYENREAAAPGSLAPLPFIDALLDPYRTWT